MNQGKICLEGEKEHACTKRDRDSCQEKKKCPERFVMKTYMGCEQDDLWTLDRRSFEEIDSLASTKHPVSLGPSQ